MGVVRVMNYRNAHEPFAYALASNIPPKYISKLYTYLYVHTFIHIFIDIIYITPYSYHILNLALRPRPTPKQVLFARAKG